jgi:hypothetical protein
MLNFTLTINGEVGDDLQSVLAALGGATQGKATTVVSRPVKEKAAQNNAAGTTSATAETSDTAAAGNAANTAKTESGSEEKITLVQLRAAIEPKVKTHLNDVLATLKKYEVANISELSEEQRPAFLADILKLN